MQKRWECLECRSHTFIEECVNCGSLSLREVEATPGDLRNADVPKSSGARGWQANVLPTPGITPPPA